jgi:hypothetical protein
MAGVLYSAECGLRQVWTATQRVLQREGRSWRSLCRPPVDCPGCGETSEDLVAKPYRPDKQIAENKWETVWERMA